MQPRPVELFAINLFGVVIKEGRKKRRRHNKAVWKFMQKHKMKEARSKKKVAMDDDI